MKLSLQLSDCLDCQLSHLEDRHHDAWQWFPGLAILRCIPLRDQNSLLLVNHLFLPLAHLHHLSTEHHLLNHHWVAHLRTVLLDDFNAFRSVDA